MKKNVMMRVASVLLVAVMLTTCVISGTFAKYVTDGTATDSARVAKWGWGDTTIAIDLFDDVYGTSVKSADGADVIAPGTAKSAAIVWTADESFAPEVDYTLSFKVADTTDIPEILEAELDWTLKIDDGDPQSFTTFTALKNALEAKTYSYKVTGNVPVVKIEIGWSWAFNGGDDAADTYLGNMDPLASLTIAVTMTATQVD